MTGKEKEKINWQNKYCEEEGDTAQRKSTVIEKGNGSAHKFAGMCRNDNIWFFFYSEKKLLSIFSVIPACIFSPTSSFVVVFFVLFFF